MSGPKFAQREKKSLKITPVPQKNVQQLLQQLKALDREFGFRMKRVKHLAKMGVIRNWQSYSGSRELFDDVLLSELIMQRPDDAKRLIAYMDSLLDKADALHKRIEKAGLRNFVGEDSYANVYIFQKQRWIAVRDFAKRIHNARMERLKEEWDSITPKRYPTMSEARGRRIPYWQRPAAKVLKTGYDWLIYPGEDIYLYIGEGGKAVPKSVLMVQRAYEAKRLKGLAKPPTMDEFLKLLIPVIPFLDAAVTEVKVMWKKGFSWGGTGRVVLNLVLAGVDVVLMGQLVTKTAARTTGRELALTLSKSEGRLAVSKAEKSVIETAIRELKPREIKDFLRMARPTKGIGLARMLEDLAIRAGEKEITGDIIRAYMKDMVGGRLRRIGWRARAGTVDFFGNGLSFFGRQRFNRRVAAEFFNELRLTIDFSAGKKLLDSMKVAGLGRVEQRIASDAVFYAFTSFSPRAQRALLKLVEKRGWNAVVREIQKEIVAANVLKKQLTKAVAEKTARVRRMQRRAERLNLAMPRKEVSALRSLEKDLAKVADPFGAGARKGLENLLPKFTKAFRYAPLHRFMEMGALRLMSPLVFEQMSIHVPALYRKMIESIYGKEVEGPRVQTEEDIRKGFQKGTERYLKEKY